MTQRSELRALQAEYETWREQLPEESGVATEPGGPTLGGGRGRGEMQDRDIRFMHRAQGLAGWAGLLVGLWLMGSFAWASFADGSTVSGVVLAVLALPVALSAMRGAYNLSRYPTAAILAVMQAFRRGA